MLLCNTVSEFVTIIWNKSTQNDGMVERCHKCIEEDDSILNKGLNGQWHKPVYPTLVSPPGGGGVVKANRSCSISREVIHIVNGEIP